MNCVATWCALHASAEDGELPAKQHAWYLEAAGGQSIPKVRSGVGRGEKDLYVPQYPETKAVKLHELVWVCVVMISSGQPLCLQSALSAECAVQGILQGSTAPVPACTAQLHSCTLRS